MGLPSAGLLYKLVLGHGDKLSFRRLVHYAIGDNYVRSNRPTRNFTSNK